MSLYNTVYRCEFIDSLVFILMGLHVVDFRMTIQVRMHIDIIIY